MFDGRLLSEPVSGRPGLVVRDGGRSAQITRLTWEGRVTARGTALTLDGVNRVPGLIRNCGGSEGDSPTSLPLHDVTCTNPDQLIAFTQEYGASTPQGEGVEAVLDSRGRVLELRSVRGGPLPSGGSSIQATGRQAAELTALARPGERLRVETTLRDDQGRRVTPSPGTDIVNAGPELVRDGRLHVTPATDGMVHPDDPSWYYGWVHKRNPRTLAGHGRGRPHRPGHGRRPQHGLPRAQHHREREGGPFPRPAGRRQPRRGRIDDDGGERPGDQRPVGCGRRTAGRRRAVDPTAQALTSGSGSGSALARSASVHAGEPGAGTGRTTREEMSIRRSCASSPHGSRSAASGT